MKYLSTRGQAPALDFTGALMQGLAPDGGLYLPQSWPRVTPPATGSYIDIAASVLAPFMEGFADPPALRAILEDTYTPRTDGFSTPVVTPLRQLDDRLAVLELFCGPTLAFKDIALQLLGRLFDHRLKQTGGRMTILGATSGDTGSAAIEGCRHAPGAQIFILYPHGRPSEVQRRQMTTVDAPNVHAIAVEGNFDDCQAIVKTLFADRDFRAAQNLSAVNSINWARIAAQIVYYFEAVRHYPGPVNIVVPTGNFGNIFAAWAARRMGANIARLIAASNRNDVLTRFFETGAMTQAGVVPSLSPSMDIEIPSNFERLLFDALGRDAGAVSAAMDRFKKTGGFDVSPAQIQDLRQVFAAARCSDDQTIAAIRATHEKYGYLIDPHTATGFHACEVLKDKLEGPVVTLACAHPAKFPDAVERATGIRPALPGHLADMHDRAERYTILPPDPEAIRAFINKKSCL